MNSTYPKGAPVMVASALAYVVEPKRYVRADGYTVLYDRPDDPGVARQKEWVPAENVTLAVVGDNVCERPLFLCACGLKHVTRPGDLPRVPQCPAGHGPMVRRAPSTYEQGWCGTWFDCPPGPVPCGNSFLMASTELLIELDQQRRAAT